ncbi:aminoglycoside phosphotransferase family protein [Paenibacillus frigoriresistens]|uniref:phosphotransferase family protein n=1 Tax=Paenibacillus alginolyticus TaxID=59839 RepID=UPI001566527C|nr:aminoglycoside phosphotransferase family protein [Paenibacillus frigoriresistens]NRF95352.1 aminoglycoside phosphotransferase family protein [Paenibacillus frigoriresistens]
MKEGWERMELPITLDLRQINEIIKPAFPGKKVMAAERIDTGLSNSNYKIHLEGSAEAFVVRIFRGDGEIADKELAVAQLVRQTVPVADFIYVDTSCSTFDKPWAVLEWKEGFLLSDVFRTGTLQDITSSAASAGSILVNIHAYTLPESGFFGSDLKITHPFSMDGERFLSFIEDILFHNQCGKWLSGELTKVLWSFCQTYSSLLSESREMPVLVHSDFNALNILMQHGPIGCSVSAVLDWEDAFSWSRHADIGNMLRYEEDGSTFEKHFIRAYQEQGAVLEDNWKLLSRLEDLVALYDMLNNSTMDTPNRMRDPALDRKNRPVLLMIATFINGSTRRNLVMDQSAERLY